MGNASILNDPVPIVAAILLVGAAMGISVAVILWLMGGAKLKRDPLISDRDPDLKPMAPLRKLMATPETSEAVAAGIAASRWRGQLANNTGWNEVTSDQAAAPEEPSMPGRDLPNPDVDTRAIKRAAETNRPLLVGPAEEEKKVETEIRDRLDRLHALFPQ